MAIKNKDFVEIEYTGTIKEENIVFDTTDKELAKKNDIFNENMEYGPVVICVGEKSVVGGLDKELEGKEAGKKYSVELEAKDAFGKKDVKLIQLIKSNKFLKQNIQPVPGLQVNIDGTIGIIKTVSGGRTLVDFNHPLSGKDITYEIKINRIVTDDEEKLRSYFKLSLKDANARIEGDEAKVEVKQEIPKEVKEIIEKKVKELIPNIKSLSIIKK